MLYANGAELGAAESVVGDVDAEGEWFYDSTTDKVTYYSTTSPNSKRMEAGADWATMETAAISKASELTKGIVAKSIVPKPSGTYDQVIVLGTASIAVALLVRPYDMELADSLERKYNNFADEYPLGLLQLVNSGKIALHNEEHPDLTQGRVIEQSLNAASTGGIMDTMGRATGNDTVKVIIDTGGTFSYGTASTITYSTWIKDSTGLMTQQYVSSETVNGDWQTMAYGIRLKFAVGIYTANDTFYVGVSSMPVETHKSIYTTQLTKK
jgi:hypothetical protein